MPSTPNIIFKTGPNCDCVCVETNCLANRENFGLQLLETMSCAKITDCITIDVAQHELDLDNPNHYGRYCKYYVLENPWDPKWDTETPEPSDYTHKLLEESWQVYQMTMRARAGYGTACTSGCFGYNQLVSFNLEDWDGPGWQFDPTNPVHIYRVLPGATYRSRYAYPKGQLPAAKCYAVSNQHNGSLVPCQSRSPWGCSSVASDTQYFHPSIRETPSMSFFSSFDDMLDSNDNPSPRSATGPSGERFHPDEKVMVVWEPYTSAMATMPDGTGIDIQSNPGGHRFIPVTHSIYFYYGGIETIELNRWGMRYSNTHRSPAMMFGTLPGTCPDLRHYSNTEIEGESITPDPNELMSARASYFHEGCMIDLEIDAGDMNRPVPEWHYPCERWHWWSGLSYHSIDICDYNIEAESCEPFVTSGEAPVELGPRIYFGTDSRNYFKNILSYGDDPIGFSMDIALHPGDPECCIAGFDCTRVYISPSTYGLTDIWGVSRWGAYFQGDPDTPIEDHNDFDFVAYLENIRLRAKTFYGAVFYLVMTKETPASNWQTLFYAKMNTPSALNPRDYSGACWDYQNLEHMGPVGTVIGGRDNVYEYKFIAIPIDTFIDFTFRKSGSTWEGIANDLIALANNPNFNPSSCQIIKSDFNGNTSYRHDELVLPTKVCVNIYKVDFEDNEWDQDSIDFVESVRLDSEDVFINPTTKYSPTTWVLDNDFLFAEEKLGEVEGCEARLALLSPLGSPCNDPQTSAQIFTSFGVPASAPPDPDCTIEEAEWQAEWNCTTEEWDVTLLSSETKAATATFGNSSSWSITGAGTRAITSYTTDALTAGDILVKYGNPTPVAAGYCD